MARPRLPVWVALFAALGLGASASAQPWRSHESAEQMQRRAQMEQQRYEEHRRERQGAYRPQQQPVARSPQFANFPNTMPALPRFQAPEPPPQQEAAQPAEAQDLPPPAQLPDADQLAQSQAQERAQAAQQAEQERAAQAAQAEQERVAAQQAQVAAEQQAAREAGQAQAAENGRKFAAGFWTLVRWALFLGVLVWLWSKREALIGWYYALTPHPARRLVEGMLYEGQPLDAKAYERALDSVRPENDIERKVRERQAADLAESLRAHRSVLAAAEAETLAAERRKREKENAFAGAHNELFREGVEYELAATRSRHQGDRGGST